MTSSTMSPELLTAYVAALDARDWVALGALLAPEFSALLVHTGEQLDAEAYVAFNAGYPGHWRLSIEVVLTDGDTGCLRARVTDGTETYYVAVFATGSGGRLGSLVEVWTEAVRAHPDRST